MSRHRDTPSDGAATYGCLIVIIIGVLIVAVAAMLLFGFHQHGVMRAVSERGKVSATPTEGFLS